MKRIKFMILIGCMSSQLFCFEKTTFGFKSGIGTWRTIFLDGPHIPTNDQGPNYSYPAGYAIAIFIENKISESLLIQNELSYQKSLFKQTIATGEEGIVEQKLATQSLNFPILLKYQTDWLLNTYFYFGPGISYLLNADYNFIDFIYEIKGDYNVTQKLPRITASFEFGVGEQLEIGNSKIIIDFRTQIGLSRQSMKNTYKQIGKWNNLGFLFMIGYQLN